MKEIRKKIIKIVSIVLAAAMIGTSSGLLAFAAQGGNDNNTSSSVSDSTETGSSEKSSSDTDGKEETVYIISNADGTTKNVIVSDWLKNGSHNATIEDETLLKDIKNVKGNESFTNSGENYKWAAEGSDIYYQGTTDKSLPVDMKITYTLDGKTVTPDEIKGKSGKVTIRIDYMKYISSRHRVVDRPPRAGPRRGPGLFDSSGGSQSRPAVRARSARNRD